MFLVTNFQETTENFQKQYCTSLFVCPFKDSNILKLKSKKNGETKDIDIDPLTYYNMIKKQKEKKKEQIKEER